MRRLTEISNFAVGMGLALAATLAGAQTWTQDGPAPRYYASDVYDVSTDQMVVFGGLQMSGAPLNDVWSVSGVVAAGQIVTSTPYHWVQVFPTGTAPSGSSGAANANCPNM